MKKEIKHEVTEEEVIENNLEGEVEAGEEIIIPAEEKIEGHAVVNNGYRW